MPVQGDWRRCRKCQVLFFNGYPDKGRCWIDGSHIADLFTNYFLSYGVPESLTAQGNWRYCEKCHALFFNGPTGGVCPVGGPHSAGTFDFVLAHDVPKSTRAQPHWRFCAKCNGMFFCAEISGGRCTSGKPHTRQSGIDYNFALSIQSGGTNPAELKTWFNAEVDAFKSLFAANAHLVTDGQFQISDFLEVALKKILADEERAAPATPWGLREVFNDFMNNPERIPSRIPEVRRLIASVHSEADFPRTLAAFSDDPGADTWVNAQFHMLWGNGGIPPGVLTVVPTAAKFRAAFIKEKGACYVTTVSMAQKFQIARNDPIDYPGTPYAGQLLANAALRSEKNGSQTVTYDPDALKDAVAKIADAMLHGYVYIFGCLSGINHSGHAFGNPEHYLLAFAVDETRTRFIFWDSDSVRSNIQLWGAGRGFGMLFLVDGHFSTAYKQEDFDNIMLGGELGGDHMAITRRHRYQIYLARPVKS